MNTLMEWITVGAGLAIGRLLVAVSACVLVVLIMVILYLIFNLVMSLKIWIEDRKRRKQDEAMDQ
ncbi:MAG: hypothetical protein EBR82_80070 [Caulobacteraceae bacterium]|nr:hypothetical protein [Caulobacteraceae bacterium]